MSEETDKAKKDRAIIEEITSWSSEKLIEYDADQKIMLKHLILVEGRIDLLATEVLGYTLEEFHLEILQLCMLVMSERGEGLLEAPRGFGKSTIGTTTFIIFLILINQDIRILVTSSTAGKAEGFLQEIKAHFEYNAVLIEIFGNFKNEKGWNATSIFVRGRKIVAKEGTLTAYGQSGQVVSKHYDVIVNDDPVNEDNARTKASRLKLRDWIYTSLYPTLMPEGFMLTTGTRYHPEDLFGYMEEMEKLKIKKAEEDKKNKKYNKANFSPEPPLRILKLKAIVNEGKSTEKSLWEKRFPLQKLKDIARKMGRIRFGGQMMQETELMKGKIIKDRDIMWYRRDSIAVSRLQIFMGVDLAIGKDSKNDKFAIVTKGYDPFTNNAYTLDYVHGQFSFRDQVSLVLWKCGKSIEEIKLICGYPNLTLQHLEEIIESEMDENPAAFALRQWPQVIRIGIESVAYQKALPTSIIDQWTTIPIIMVKTNVDKTTRLIKYSPRFENHQEFLPEDGSADAIRDDLIAFPEGDFDDLPDAHEICNSVKDLVIGHGDDDRDDREGGSARAF